ncbi:SDR family NAD(P)-dependent oxidoreductase [Allonocardiopsis opalescens]|uniref:3-oxoacyl-[acyl-carrier protein] reductase n=1 Tax=Allonocardiopsis opalescens TaxID=1144618 RepID=A0A2T0QB28_9ACTN|nr:glucose 1-dehydrogenase [Allonocardiopsis opalescens]PRY01021.1 3-oxoacyl-[acyl-carrier protein] reductase [Allonocardiopsis opalescens]
MSAAEAPAETPAEAPQEAAPARVAVVTGGSRGLGRIVVERLLDRGWRVAVLSRTSNDFVAETTESAPDAFFWQPADLNEPHALRAAVRAVVRRFGRIDLLVNNAGVLHQELFLTTSPKQVDTLIATNLVAPIILTQGCARAMTQNGGGTIVNVSSINAIRGHRGVAVYSAAKAGLDGLSRSLARELGPLGIRVNSIVPGFFDSDMTTQVTDTNRERIQGRTPLGRLGTAQEVADAVLYLASEESSFITGQTIVVDGGITC